MLSQLYGLFQKFIRFDTRFRDTLWAEVDLESSSREVSRICQLIKHNFQRRTFCGIDPLFEME